MREVPEPKSGLYDSDKDDRTSHVQFRPLCCDEVLGPAALPVPPSLFRDMVRDGMICEHGLTSCEECEFHT